MACLELAVYESKRSAQTEYDSVSVPKIRRTAPRVRRAKVRSVVGKRERRAIKCLVRMGGYSFVAGLVTVGIVAGPDLLRMPLWPLVGVWVGLTGLLALVAQAEI